MKNLQIKLPKVRIKTNIFLWFVFGFIVMMEMILLYNSLYADAKKPVSELTVQTAPALRINFEASNLAAKWFEDQAGYVLPDYSLQSENVGRENPFVEY